MFRWIGIACLTLVTLAACKPGRDEPLGPPDSYLLLAPLPPGPERADDAFPLVGRIEPGEATGLPLERLFASESFAAEMLRTAYLVKQLVRDLKINGAPAFPDLARRKASDALYVVVGLDRPLPGSGLRVTGSWFGGPAVRPEAVWLGLPADLEGDRALVQTVTGRLATLVARTIAGKGVPEADPQSAAGLVEGYRMAMEVIAREWRVGTGPAGVVPSDAGSTQQRDVFARVRENRFVVDDTGALRPAAALLADPGVAATIIYRMAQSRGLAQKVAPVEFYAPVASDRIPPGVSPAAVLGPMRNFQLKLASSWAQAILRGKAPVTIADLIDAYGAILPGERAEAVRLFVVTTFGATIKPGGVSTRAEDSQAALAELTALSAEAAAGRRSLRQALAAP